MTRDAARKTVHIGGIDYYAKLADVDEPIRIMADFGDKASKKERSRAFLGFNSHNELSAFHNRHRDLSLHEITRCGEENVHQRLFFDVDAEYAKFPVSKAQIELAYDLLIDSVVTVLNYKGVSDTTFHKLVSHREEKFSVHVVFKNVLIDAQHYRCLLSLVRAHFQFELEGEGLPLCLADIIDEQVYSTRHALRMHLSHKAGRQELLKIEGDDGNVFDPSTMVTFIDPRQRQQLVECAESCIHGVKKATASIGTSDEKFEFAVRLVESMQNELGSIRGAPKKPYINLLFDHGKPCPTSGKLHSSENGFVAVDDHAIRLVCRRHPIGDPSRCRILHRFDNTVVDVPKPISEAQTISTTEDYLPEIAATVGSFSTLYLKSDLGSGKSTQIHKWIADNAGGVIVFVTYRINLAAAILESSKKFMPAEAKPFEKYNDINEDKIPLSEHGRIIIQNESLHRLVIDRSVDLVVVDEAMSFVQQATSDLNPSKRGYNRMVFRNLIRNATQAVMTDALLDTTGIESYESFRLDPKRVVWVNEPKTPWAPTVKRYQDPSDWRNSLSAEIALGRKIYVSTTCGEHWISALSAIVRKTSPNAKILELWGGKEGNEEVVSGINEELIKYDLVIASPCMSAGISFDVKGYFDNVYCFIGQFGPTAIDVIQSLRRIRHTKTNEIVLCTASYHRSLPTSISAIRNYAERRLQTNSAEFITNGLQCVQEGTKTYFEYPDSPDLNWLFFCERVVNLNSIDVSDTVVRYLESKGAKFHSTVEKPEAGSAEAVAAKLERKEFSAAAKTAKKKGIDAIAAAPVVSEAEYETLRQMKRRGPEKTAKLEKYQLLAHYGLVEPRNSKLYGFIEPELSAALMKPSVQAEHFRTAELREQRIIGFNEPDFVATYSKSDVRAAYRGIPFRELTAESIAEIDAGRASHLLDDEKLDFEYLLGRHVVISKIREIVGDGCDYEPLSLFIESLISGGCTLVEGWKKPTPKTLVQSVNSIIGDYGYKLQSRRDNGKSGVRKLYIEDIASTFFNISRVHKSTHYTDVRAMRLSGNSKLPNVVIYTELPIPSVELHSESTPLKVVDNDFFAK
jgi:hypothetical protein